MKYFLRILAQSANVAFSMYSSIPMPQLEWTKDNMKYALCFFPLIGIVEGCLLFVWIQICSIFNLNSILMGAVCTAIPIFISGGIHLDGFCDTVDALASHQEPTRKLEILKDPHTGAFATIGCVLYLLITFALWTQPEVDYLEIFILYFTVGLIASRALSGLSLVCFPCAKSNGLVATFSSRAEKSFVRNTMVIYLIICVFLLVDIHIINATCLIAGWGVTFFYYYKMSQKHFGGITGDLAGYFVQINQIITLSILVMTMIFINKSPLI